VGGPRAAASVLCAAAPKSLDRNDFASLKLGNVSPADGAATLTAFTAEASPDCCIVAEGARGAGLLPARRPQSHLLRMLGSGYTRRRSKRPMCSLVGRRHRGAGVRVPAARV